MKIIIPKVITGTVYLLLDMLFFNLHSSKLDRTNWYQYSILQNESKFEMWIRKRCQCHNDDCVHVENNDLR